MESEKVDKHICVIYIAGVRTFTREGRMFSLDPVTRWPTRLSQRGYRVKELVQDRLAIDQRTSTFARARFAISLAKLGRNESPTGVWANSRGISSTMV